MTIRTRIGMKMKTRKLNFWFISQSPAGLSAKEARKSRKSERRQSAMLKLQRIAPLCLLNASYRLLEL